MNFGFLVFGVTDYAGKMMTCHYGAVAARSREMPTSRTPVGSWAGDWPNGWPWSPTVARISTRSPSPRSECCRGEAGRCPRDLPGENRTC